MCVCVCNQGTVGQDLFMVQKINNSWWFNRFNALSTPVMRWLKRPFTLLLHHNASFLHQCFVVYPTASMLLIHYWRHQIKNWTNVDLSHEKMIAVHCKHRKQCYLRKLHQEVIFSNPLSCVSWDVQSTLLFTLNQHNLMGIFIPTLRKIMYKIMFQTSNKTYLLTISWPLYS